MTKIDDAWRDPQNPAFDFIVVGAGAGGAPLAARLVERGYTVLVLEMGPGEQEPGKLDTTRVPMLHPETTEAPRHSLRYFVAHCQSDDKQVLDPKVHGSPDQPEEHGVFYPRAQGIGGCTVHNAMITMCGPSEDWDEIAESTGDESWRGERMRAYFQRVEQCHYARPGWWANFKSLLGFRTQWDGSRHGTRGWLQTTLADLRFLGADRHFLRVVYGGVHGALTSGLDRIDDFLHEVLSGRVFARLDPNHWETMRQSPQGIALIPTAITPNGERSGPRERLLSLTRPESPHRKRLTILTGVCVTRVHLEQEPLRATGVVCVEQEHVYRADTTPVQPTAPEVTIHCRREVILCGGAFNTPQLLMLSGIGDAAELQEAGVRPAHKLPGVGKNLQDRYEVPITATLTDRFRSLDGVSFSSAEPHDRHLRQWLARPGGSAYQRGVYATNGGLIGIFRCSSQSRTPDLFIFASPVYFRGYEVGWSSPGSLLRRRDESPEQLADAPRNQLTWLVLKARTWQKGGTVKLRNDSPFSRPVIDFDSFAGVTDAALEPDRADPNHPVYPASSDPDLEALFEGVEFVKSFLAEAQQAGWIKEYGEPDIEGEPFHGNVRKWIKHIAWGHHACGTCKIGDPRDEKAVLDSRFRVRGVGGLRVVDASVFPRIPGFFIVANIYMIAEKAADVLTEDNRLPAEQRPPEVLAAERLDPVLPSNRVQEARRLYPAELEAAEAMQVRARRRAAARAATPNQDATQGSHEP